jgi:two-component system, NtrC family, sensor kinase
MKSHDHNEIRVLLCDDQAIVGTALRQMLASTERVVIHHTVCETDLFDDLEAFQPTVILQDLILENGCGIELLSAIRASEKFGEIPVIMLSSTDDAKTKFDAFERGASDYVVKFPEPFELLGRISYHSRAYRNLLERRDAERSLAQKSRLEALGNLSAGVAHEMNTPLQYISANLGYLASQIHTLGQSCAEREELEAAVAESLQGVEQLSGIVRAMKAFAHPGKDEHVAVAVNDILTDIRILSRSEWKDSCEVTLVLSPDMKLAKCSPVAISQVFLNLLINAVHAIRESRRSNGKIEIISSMQDGQVQIEFRDNGCGISDEVKDRIFEPYFTTKEFGDGSGQGLALAKATIEHQHRGSLFFHSVLDQGTSFFIRLPSATSMEGI